jgi:hypothetical protein
MKALSRSAQAAAQKVLAGEHAAVYAYGVVAARTSGAMRTLAAAAYDAHRARRSRLETLLRDAGTQPVTSEPAYDLGALVTTEAIARALAARVENGVAATCADLVLAASGDLRVEAARWQTDAAVRAAGWSGTTLAFPGLGERSATSASPSSPGSPSASAT